MFCCVLFRVFRVFCFGCLGLFCLGCMGYFVSKFGSNRTKIKNESRSAFFFNFHKISTPVHVSDFSEILAEISDVPLPSQQRGLTDRISEGKFDKKQF